MKHFLSYIALVAFTSVCFSCTSKSDSLKNKSKKIEKEFVAAEAEAKALKLSLEELQAMPKAVRAKRAAGLILVDYLTLKDSVIYLDISREEALKLGVKSKFYDEYQQEISETNALIKDYNKRGESIQLPDIAKKKPSAVKATN